jgi:hypothetical protein
MTSPEIPDQKSYFAKISTRISPIGYLVRDLRSTPPNAKLALQASAIESRVYSPSLTWYVGNPKPETLKRQTPPFWVEYKSDANTNLELRVSGALRTNESLNIIGGAVQVEPITIEDDEEFNSIFSEGRSTSVSGLHLSRTQPGEDVFEGYLNLLTIDIPKL